MYVYTGVGSVAATLLGTHSITPYEDKHDLVHLLKVKHTLSFGIQRYLISLSCRFYAGHEGSISAITQFLH